MIDVLYSYRYVVKFAQREISEIVRCLPGKKIAWQWLRSCRYCVDRAQSLSRPAPDNILRLLKIVSISVHLQLSYSQTRENRQKRAVK